MLCCDRRCVGSACVGGAPLQRQPPRGGPCHRTHPAWHRLWAGTGAPGLGRECSQMGRCPTRDPGVARTQRQAVSVLARGQRAWRASPGRTVLLRCFSWLYASMTPSKRSSYLGACAPKGRGVSHALLLCTGRVKQGTHRMSLEFSSSWTASVGSRVLDGCTSMEKVTVSLRSGSASSSTSGGRATSPAAAAAAMATPSRDPGAALDATGEGWAL